jgi:Na+-driven multidrug efflux pump
MGAGNYKNITKIYVACSTIAIIASAAMCSAMVLERVPLARIFSAAPAVVAAAGLRLFVVGIGYFLNMLINITAGVMRGMGASLPPAFVSFGGICVFRIIWLVTVFPAFRSYLTLLLTYPASWILTLSVDIACFFIVKRRIIGRPPKNAAGPGCGVTVSC